MKLSVNVSIQNITRQLLQSEGSTVAWFLNEFVKQTETRDIEYLRTVVDGLDKSTKFFFSRLTSMAGLSELKRETSKHEPKQGENQILNQIPYKAIEGQSNRESRSNITKLDTKRNFGQQSKQQPSTWRKHSLEPDRY